MAEKKEFMVRLERNASIPVRHAIFVKQFTIREDSADEGLVEILLMPALGVLATHCLVFDHFILSQNHRAFVRYLAGITADADDAAENKKLPSAAAERYFFSNTFQLSFSGVRAETLFGLTFVHDSAMAKRQAAASSTEVPVLVDPILAVYSSLGFQKKLISELFRVFNLK
jgi:hypothetical protein